MEQGDSYAPVLISNAHVMELLRDNLASRETQHTGTGGRNKRASANRFRHRDWMETQVHTYLQSTPCAQLEKSRRAEFQSALRSNKKQATVNGNGSSSKTTTGFDLTEAESLQILNFMPTEPVEIHLMIEELHARMSEKQQEGLLEFIGSYKVKEDGDDDGDGDDDATVMDTTTATANGTSTTTNGNGNVAVVESGSSKPSVSVKKEEEEENGHADI
jgi:hypothetical protein